MIMKSLLCGLVLLIFLAWISGSAANRGEADDFGAAAPCILFVLLAAVDVLVIVVYGLYLLATK